LASSSDTLGTTDEERGLFTFEGWIEPPIRISCHQAAILTVVDVFHLALADITAVASPP
ncbi:unnamed protein product, partial [Scytosiphon promiscuus]